VVRDNALLLKKKKKRSAVYLRVAIINCLSLKTRRHNSNIQKKKQSASVNKESNATANSLGEHKQKTNKGATRDFVFPQHEHASPTFSHQEVAVSLGEKYFS